MEKPVIGLALGSGSARGWAHIGVIRALAEAGVEPDVVCGASIGALVGAAYASGNLDALEGWVRELSWWDVVRFMDVRLLAGGFIEGGRLMEILEQQVGDTPIESLPTPFAAVATDMQSGREVWLQEGSLLEAVRASIALPGLFTPVQRKGRWLIDGGLVNPVPISICRAMGAEQIIAVNLNGDIVGKHLATTRRKQKATGALAEGDLFNQLLSRLNITPAERPVHKPSPATPGLFEVLASSLNIMQDRITRSRMAGDPPDVVIAPRLAHLGLLEFDRADAAIREGHASVERMLPALQPLIASRQPAP